MRKILDYLIISYVKFIAIFVAHSNLYKFLLNGEFRHKLLYWNDIRRELNLFEKDIYRYYMKTNYSSEYLRIRGGVLRNLEDILNMSSDYLRLDAKELAKLRREAIDLVPQKEFVLVSKYFGGVVFRKKLLLLKQGFSLAFLHAFGTLCVYAGDKRHVGLYVSPEFYKDLVELYDLFKSRQDLTERH